jgi:hypothetical protein
MITHGLWSDKRKPALSEVDPTEWFEALITRISSKHSGKGRWHYIMPVHNAIPMLSQKTT